MRRVYHNPCLECITRPMCTYRSGFMAKRLPHSEFGTREIIKEHCVDLYHFINKLSTARLNKIIFNHYKTYNILYMVFDRDYVQIVGREHTITIDFIDNTEE